MASEVTSRRMCGRPYGRRPFAAVPKAMFPFAMALMDKVEGWNDEQWVGGRLRCVHVDLHQSRIMRWAQT